MRQWAITIGINHYQHLPPLSYARQDAEWMQRGLVSQAEVPPDRVLLFSETSSGNQPATWPDRLTLQTGLDRLAHHSFQPGDYLWFFFSGYGLCHQGQDYLMPIDAHPQNCRGTALPMELVFEYLKHCPIEHILVLLDFSRPVGTEPPVVGTHTIRLAEQMGIPTILSCRPGQVSQSTVALQQGLFTRSLLDALQTQHNITPAYLERFLNDRLAALGEFYERPAQQVVTICPSHLLHQALLIAPANVLTPSSEPLNLTAASESSRQDLQLFPSFSTSSSSPSNLAAALQPEPLISLSSEGWHWFKLGVGILAALIFSGLLLSHLQKSISTGQQVESTVRSGSPLQSPELSREVSPTSPPLSSTTLLPIQPTPAFSSILGPAQARTLVKQDQASPFWDAIQEVRTISPGHPEFSLMPQAIASWSQDIWTIAQQRAVRGEFDTAILAANLVPPDQTPYQPARAAIRQWCPLFRFNPQRNVDQQKQAAAICLSEQKRP